MNTRRTAPRTAPRTRYNDPLVPATITLVDDGECIACPATPTPPYRECDDCYDARMILRAKLAAARAARKAAR